MFCEHCGAKLEPGDVFCVHCGNKVDYNGAEAPKEEPKVEEPIKEKPKLDDTQELALNEDPTAQPEPVMVFVPGPEKSEEPKKNAGGSTGLKIGVGIAAVVVALLAAALIFFLVSGTSLSDLTGTSSNGEYSYSYGETADQTEKQTTKEASFEEDYDEPETTTRRKTTEKRTTATDEDETPTGDGAYYRVSVGSGNRLSFRAKPDEDSTKLNRIDNGTRLYITEISGNWGKTTYDGETGWVCMTQDGDRYVVKD